jgi:hypothetical protein
MVARRIVSLAALALVAIINPTFIVDAQIIPEFPGGSLDVGGVPTFPGTHSGTRNPAAIGLFRDPSGTSG